MEHGNLLHPKIITVALRGFLSLIWMGDFQLELPADAGRGSTGVHQTALWGVAACLSPFLHWRIESFWDNVKFGSGGKRIAVICISGQNQIWADGSQIQFSFSAEEMWSLRGRDQGAERVLQVERRGPSSESTHKSKRKAWQKHLNTLAEQKTHGSQKLINCKEKRWQESISGS